MLVAVDERRLALPPDDLDGDELVDETAGLDGGDGALLALARECVRAHRYERGITLVILDIDDFKATNDRLGHLGGDAVLTAVAEPLFRSAQVAHTPSLVQTPEELTAANVVASGVESIGLFAGPALGGLVLAVSGGSCATTVSGKYRPTLSTLGAMTPTTGAGPQAPAAAQKRHAGLVRYTSSHRSPSDARLAEMHSCNQPSQTPTKASETRRRRKSP